MVQGVKSTRRRAVQDVAVLKLHFHFNLVNYRRGLVVEFVPSEQRQDCPTVPPYNFLNHVGPRAGLIHLLTSRHQDISLSIPP